jgi:hypothetical protein
MTRPTKDGDAFQRQTLGLILPLLSVKKKKCIKIDTCSAVMEGEREIVFWLCWLPVLV